MRPSSAELQADDASSARVESPTRELKLVGSGARGAQLASILAARCRPDPEHPHGRISSIYYDSPDLRLFARKIDSDYLKLKARVRWYADPTTGVPGGPAFFELKRKQGGLRQKSRVRLPMGAAEIAVLELESARLARLPASLPEDLRTPAGLLPLLTISFERRRFIEPSTGARVALDVGIHLPRLHRGRLPCPAGVTIGAAVVELKGDRVETTSLYRLLRALGLRRQAFSKYGACLGRIIGNTQLG